jgi:cytochrome c oxidase subunit 2
MDKIARRTAVVFFCALFGVLAAPAAMAQMPHEWQIGMQAPGSPVAAQLQSLHNLVLAIIAATTILVAGLLLYVMLRFSAKRNPVPSQTSHNTLIEVIWTVVPVLILVVIAIPSFRLVYFEDRTRDADLTIKVTGHQWYWEYDYGDAAKVDFTSRVVMDEDLKPGQLRLLDVDNQLVVPAGKNVRILTTSADVIHSFYIPSLGVQRYAIPGRTIETWFRVDKPGAYYGECNQICGTNHSAMPISIKAVSPEEFQAWLVEARTKFADATPVDSQKLAAPVALAANIR